MDKRFDATVSKWLEESAPSRLPERVLDTTFERTRRMRQQNGWRALLAHLHFAQFAPTLAGAMVVLLVAALALGLYVNRPGIGGNPSPTEPASPVATASPSVEPTPEASPSVEPTAEPSPSASPEPTSTPAESMFVGAWTATDNPPDRSSLTMDVTAKPDGTFDVVITDDSAAVCKGTPSTMTGIADETDPGTFVIAQPDYRCDNGTKPHSLSGPPLVDQLKNYTMVYDDQTDQLREPGGVVWSRAGTGQ